MPTVDRWGNGTSPRQSDLTLARSDILYGLRNGQQRSGTGRVHTHGRSMEIKLVGSSSCYVILFIQTHYLNIPIPFHYFFVENNVILEIGIVVCACKDTDFISFPF